MTGDQLQNAEDDAKAELDRVRPRVVDDKPDLDADAICELATHTLNLVAEVRRLMRGDFTPEEFQHLCHHRDERPGCTPTEFRKGCQEYQLRLFGELKDGPPLTLPPEFGELKD